MRVEDRNLADVGASQPGKTAEPRDIERVSDGKAQQIRGTPWPDRVQLSDLAGLLSRILSRDSAERAGRVTHLTRMYQDGRYRVDAGAVSSAMAGEMRSAGTEGV